MKRDYAVLVGLDWADQKHVLCSRETATGRGQTLTLEQSPERINRPPTSGRYRPSDR